MENGRRWIKRESSFPIRISSRLALFTAIAEVLLDVSLKNSAEKHCPSVANITIDALDANSLL